jgi:hypothetical protein
VDKYQNRIEPERLVFIDETWTKTKMEQLGGWAQRSVRLTANVPHGHWKTTTFVAALRHDRIDAPWLLEGPIHGEAFRTYVERVLIPTWGRATSSSGTISAATRAKPCAGLSAQLAPSYSSCRNTSPT